MAVNLASKYSSKVDERFKKQSVTAPWTSGEYDFIGVSTVRAYNISTSAMNDYTRTGTARYGTPAELQDSYQEMTLAKDRSFAFTVDKGNDTEQMGVKNAGKALRRQIDEVIVPELDIYRLGKWADYAGNGAIISAPAANTIAGLIMDGTVALDDDLVPPDGRALFIRADYYKFLKLCSEFTYIDSLAAKALGMGIVGEFDGMKVVKVPSSYLPNCYFMIVHKSAPFAPAKLTEYKTHVDPPGINGVLVEGRVRHDAFVLGQKCNGIYVAGISTKMCAAVTSTYVGGSTDTITLASATAGTTIKYTLDGSDPKFSPTVLTYSQALDTSGYEAGTYVVRAYAAKSGLINSITSTTSHAVSDA